MYTSRDTYYATYACIIIYVCKLRTVIVRDKYDGQNDVYEKTIRTCWNVTRIRSNKNIKIFFKHFYFLFLGLVARPRIVIYATGFHVTYISGIRGVQNRSILLQTS